MSKTEAPLASDLKEVARLMGSCVSKISGKTFLISGGCGFIGQHLTKLLIYLNARVLKKPCKIIVLDNFINADSKSSIFTAQSNVVFIRHDIIKPFNCKESLDYIIHSAGIASPYYYRKYPLETLEVATVGTKNMLRLACQKRVEGLLFFSSSEIYGDPDPRFVPTKESYRGNVASIGPRACYDESKRLGETLCHIFHEVHGVPTKIVRPFNVYGPGMREADYRVLPNFASCIFAGKPLSIYGTGLQTRTFCYIVDALNGFFRALLNGQAGEVYNIGTPKPEISMVDLVQQIELVVHRRVEITQVPYPDAYPSDEPMRRCPDITKAQAHLGYQPAIGLKEGLRRFFNWAAKNYKGR